MERKGADLLHSSQYFGLVIISNEHQPKQLGQSGVLEEIQNASNGQPLEQRARKNHSCPLEPSLRQTKDEH